MVMEIIFRVIAIQSDIVVFSVGGAFAAFSVVDSPKIFGAIVI